ncbi:MAG: hypothetical protein BWX47_02118 [candidate division Hyd24-12 bacterium ADurb.Bin004]|nr:MAG: hypothetical protein BWX47_02118 [candidate division Hyd24-12 bacterium ADurb.Bin004]
MVDPSMERNAASDPSVMEPSVTRYAPAPAAKSFAAPGTRSSRIPAAEPEAVRSIMTPSSLESPEDTLPAALSSAAKALITVPEESISWRSRDTLAFSSIEWRPRFLSLCEMETDATNRTATKGMQASPRRGSSPIIRAIPAETRTTEAARFTEEPDRNHETPWMSPITRDNR